MWGRLDRLHAVAREHSVLRCVAHLVISTSIPRNLLRDHVSRVLGAPWTVPARILVLFLAPFLPPRATRYAVLLSNPRWGLIAPAIHSSRINRPRAKDAVVLRGDNEASCPSLSLKDGPVLCVDQRCTQSITERLLGRLDHPWGVALFTKVIPLMQQHTRDFSIGSALDAGGKGAVEECNDLLACSSPPGRSRGWLWRWWTERGRGNADVI